MIKTESAHLKIARPQARPTSDGSRPYRLAAHALNGAGRSTRPVRVSDNVTIGGTAIAVIAGPCSVESAEMIVSIANGVRSMGAVMLRGGAFKPRTSPYSFNGLGACALEFLESARSESTLPIVTRK